MEVERIVAQLGAETDLVAKKAMEAQQRKARINMQRSIFKGMEDSKDKGVRTNIHIFGRIVKGLKAIGLFFWHLSHFKTPVFRLNVLRKSLQRHLPWRLVDSAREVTSQLPTIPTADVSGCSKREA